MEGGVFDILGKGLQEIQQDNYMILSTSISLIRFARNTTR
jgi:hypothetical protein